MGWFILSSIEWNGMKLKIMQNAQSTKIPHFKYKVVFLSQITQASFSYEISLLKIIHKTDHNHNAMLPE